MLRTLSARGCGLGLILATAGSGLPDAAAQTPDAGTSAAQRVHTDDVVRFRVRVVAARASEWTAWAAERGFSEALGKNRLFGSLRQAVQAFRDEAQAAPK